jgi:hypothetical protein
VNEQRKHQSRPSVIDQSTFDFAQYFGRADMQPLPRFTATLPDLGSDLREQLYLIAGILIACLLLFWFSFVLFIKYDVR